MANKQINQYPDLAAYTGAYKLLVDNGSGSYYSFTMSKVSPVEGSTSITTLGTIATGTWQGTAIADSYIASASTWNNLVSANPSLTSDDTDILSLSGQDFTFVSGNLAKLDENETVTGVYTFAANPYVNNSVYFGGRTTAGTTRLLGINLGDILYIGSIDKAVAATYFMNGGSLAGQITSAGTLDWNYTIQTDGYLKTLNTTDATSTTTGSLITAGGLGVAKSAYVGGTISIGTTNNTELLNLYKYQSNVGIRMQGSSANWYILNNYSSGGNLQFLQNANIVLTLNKDYSATFLGKVTAGADATSGYDLLTYNQLHNASLTPDFAGVEINGASINTAGALSNVAYLNQVNNFNVASTTNPTNLFRNTSYSSTDASGESSLGLYFLNHGAAKIAAYKTSTNTTGIKLYGEYGFNAQRLLATFNANYNVEFYGNLTAAGTIQATTGIFTNLTDNYVPISTASGLDDSPISTNGSTTTFTRAGKTLTINPNYGETNTKASIEVTTGMGLSIYSGSNELLSFNAGTTAATFLSSATATSFINSTYNDATKTLQGDGSVRDFFDGTEDIDVNSVSIGGSAVGSAALYDAWTGTQAAYDALGTWDSNTLYIIIG